MDNMENYRFEIIDYINSNYDFVNLEVLESEISLILDSFFDDVSIDLKEFANDIKSAFYAELNDRKNFQVSGKHQTELMQAWGDILLTRLDDLSNLVQDYCKYSRSKKCFNITFKNLDKSDIISSVEKIMFDFEYEYDETIILIENTVMNFNKLMKAIDTDTAFEPIRA